MRSQVMLAAVAVAAGALAVAGCGGDSNTTTTTATTPETTTTEPATTAPAATTTTAPATTPAPKPTTIRIVVKSGQPQGGIQRPTIAKGKQVVLVVTADAGEAVHLHGYNIEKPVTPGKPTRIAFTANLPGRFEVELHHPDTLLAVLEVQP